MVSGPAACTAPSEAAHRAGREKSAAGLDFVVGDVHGEFSTRDRCRVGLIGVWRGLLDRYVAVGWR